MPKISIITPTKDRERFLPSIWECVRTQTLQDIEWLVHDSSQKASDFLQKLEESDERVRYFRDPDPANPMEIGPKRNALVDEAEGDYIVHFDDDDYYAPGYVEAMLAFLSNKNADIVKLFGFFLFHEATGAFGYWDLERQFPLHYRFGGGPHIDLAPKTVNKNDEWGYGFSYVYKRAVWEARKFDKVGHGEDQPFATEAIKSFKGEGMQDTGFLALHVIHGSNTSYSYPQQFLPTGFGQAYFPDFTPPPPGP